MSENHLGIITSVGDGHTAGPVIKSATEVGGNLSAAAKLGKTDRDALTGTISGMKVVRREPLKIVS